MMLQMSNATMKSVVGPRMIETKLGWQAPEHHCFTSASICTATLETRDRFMHRVFNPAWIQNPRRPLCLHTSLSCALGGLFVAWQTVSLFLTRRKLCGSGSVSKYVHGESLGKTHASRSFSLLSDALALGGRTRFLNYKVTPSLECHAPRDLLLQRWRLESGSVHSSSILLGLKNLEDFPVSMDHLSFAPGGLFVAQTVSLFLKMQALRLWIVLKISTWGEPRQHTRLEELLPSLGRLRPLARGTDSRTTKSLHFWTVTLHVIFLLPHVTRQREQGQYTSTK